MIEEELEFEYTVSMPNQMLVRCFTVPDDLIVVGLFYDLWRDSLCNESSYESFKYNNDLDCYEISVPGKYCDIADIDAKLHELLVARKIGRAHV